MNTIELQNEIIRKVLQTNNIDILKKVKDFFLTAQTDQTYKLTEAERLILEEREANYYKDKKRLSNDDVFNEIAGIL